MFCKKCVGKNFAKFKAIQLLSTSVKRVFFQEELQNVHCIKSVRILSFSGPYFPAFGLNTEIYGVNLRVQSKCGKMRVRKTRNMGTFHKVVTYHQMRYPYQIVYGIS